MVAEFLGAHDSARDAEADSIRGTELKTRPSIDLGGGVEMAFRLIPRGEFRMGSRYGLPNEQPVHRVIIPEDFWLAETPVTQKQYACFDPDHRSHFHGSPDNPVEKVDWHQARKFCGWLTQARAQQPWPDELVELQPDLPTETHWEYACRAGTQTDYYTGDGEHVLVRAGWYGRNSGDSTHQVGRKTPNAFGLYDMHSNVGEWCRDVWSEDEYRYHANGRIEPVGPGKGASETDHSPRTFRGGTWIDSPDFCRSAVRIGYNPGGADHDLGFRVGLFPGSACPTK